MTVLSSGVVIVSSGPMSETTAPALSSGFRIRSNDIFTAADVSGVPSWNLAPSRRVNVNFLPESSIVHFVASAGCGFWSASSVISVSTMFCAISPAAAPVVSAGSIESILSHCPQVSVPPLVGTSDFAAAAVAGGVEVPGVHAITATLAAASAERRRNSRRYIVVSRASGDRSVVPTSDVLPIDRSSQDVEHFLELCVADGEWHERADDVAVEAGAEHQQPAVAGALDDRLDRRGLLCLAVLDQLDGLHRADPADLADDGVVRGHRVEAAAQRRPDRGRARGEPVALDDLDRLDRGDPGDGVSAECAAQRTRPQRVEEVGAPGDRTDREAGTERLAGHEQIRRHAAVLDREHAAGARHARLDLVGDEQDVVTAADRGDALQEARRRDDED